MRKSSKKDQDVRPLGIHILKLRLPEHTDVKLLLEELRQILERPMQQVKR